MLSPGYTSRTAACDEQACVWHSRPATAPGRALARTRSYDFAPAEAVSGAIHISQSEMII